MGEAQLRLAERFESFARNTVDYMQRERDLLFGGSGLPALEHDLAHRPVLVVVRGYNYKEDLAVLRPYIRDVRPVLLGVDGGADALIEAGYTPDLILGDMDSVSDEALSFAGSAPRRWFRRRQQTELVLHAYQDGHAPGRERLEALGVPFRVVEAAGTSEDAAFLLAHEKGAETIVAVGSHGNLREFLDKGREGMSSTFLVRLRVGEILMDAKGVSRVYSSRIRTRDAVLLVAAAMVAIAAVVVGLAAAPPVRLAAVRTVPPVAVRPERAAVISFRYHVVTIVAVFLALAIGLLGGAAFVQPALQEELQNQTDRLRRDLADRTRQIGDLRDQIGALGGFAEAAMPYLTSGKLTGTPVVLVTPGRGRGRGARTGAGVVAERGCADPHDGLRDRRARLGGPGHPGTAAPDRWGHRRRPAEELPALAAEALAQGLSPRRRSSVDDILAELLSEGFLAPIGAGPSAGDPGGDRGARSGRRRALRRTRRAAGRSRRKPSRCPLVGARLAGLDVPVAAGESLLSDYPTSRSCASNGADGTVTVDDLDLTMGGAALVLGLEELLATGTGGAYGVKDGAEPLPPAP